MVSAIRLSPPHRVLTIIGRKWRHPTLRVPSHEPVGSKLWMFAVAVSPDVGLDAAHPSNIKVIVAAANTQVSVSARVRPSITASLAQHVAQDPDTLVSVCGPANLGVGTQVE